MGSVLRRVTERVPAVVCLTDCVIIAAGNYAHVAVAIERIGIFVVLAGKLYLIAGLIHTVVTEHDLETGIIVGNIQLHGYVLTRLVFYREDFQHTAGLRHHRHSGDEMIVLDPELQLTGVSSSLIPQAQGLRIHGGTFRIHGDGDHKGLIRLGIPIVQAGVNGQLQSGVVGQIIAIAVPHIKGPANLCGEHHGQVHAVLGVVVALADVLAGDLVIDLAGVRVRPGEGHGLGRTHHADVDLVNDIIQVITIRRQDILRRVIGSVCNVGVQAQVIGLGENHMGIAVVAQDILGLVIPAGVIYGSLAPVTVEAHERQT